MDVSHVINESDVLSAKKSNKKRKNSEICDLGGKELANEGTKKKMKTKVMSDIHMAVLDEDFGAGVDKSHQKENENKDTSRLDLYRLGHDNKRERKMRKSKTGDKGEASRIIETSYVKVHNKGVNDLGVKGKEIIHAERNDGKDMNDKEKNGVMKFDAKVASDIELMKRGEEYAREKEFAKKKNKVKHKGKGNLVDSVDHDSHLDCQTHREITEKAEPVKNKKQKNKKEDMGDGSSNKKQLARSHMCEVNDGEDNRFRGNTSSARVKKKKTKIYKDADFAGTDGPVGDASSTENPTDHELTEKAKFVEIKKKKRKQSDDSGAGSLDEELMKNIHFVSISDSEKCKEKFVRSNTEGDGKADMLVNNDRNDTTEDFEHSNHNKKSKNVKISEIQEVFPFPDISSKGKKKLEDGGQGKKNLDDGLVRGKRFSKEEDDIIQNAVFKYIEDHQLGEEGLDMVLKCRSHPEVRNCWKEIGEALPCRPYLAVYNRAHILFERSETRKWTPEEIELVKKFHEKHGPDWKTLSVELGKHRFHVKDAWRRYKFPNLKKGNWSQEEFQTLFNLVNMDLSMKAFAEKKTKHGMLRDNICWEAISDQLLTRSNALCCQKWYNQLTSPMVAEGKWANADDYRLLIALVDLDAACEEDVDWDNLLEHRSGDVSHKRWKQMVRHIGENGSKLFSEQVDILSQRNCPDMLDAREAYGNKPPVD